MSSGNDASTHLMAMVNCAYCAVGGLVGQPASEIMRKLYALLGKPTPTGASEADTGVNGFSLLALLRKGRPESDLNKLTNEKPLELQIEGVVAFLQHYGCTTEVHGTAKNPLRFADANEYMNAAPLWTRFLAVAGDADFGTFITTLAHWTVGQKQEDGVNFYDHQLKITNAAVRDSVVKKSKGHSVITADATVSAKEPMGPLGQKLDSSDKRCIIITVTKG
jgi:hypothetical protein